MNKNNKKTITLLLLVLSLLISIPTFANSNDDRLQKIFSEISEYNGNIPVKSNLSSDGIKALEDYYSESKQLMNYMNKSIGWNDYDPSIYEQQWKSIKNKFENSAYFKTNSRSNNSNNSNVDDDERPKKKKPVGAKANGMAKVWKAGDNIPDFSEGPAIGTSKNDTNAYSNTSVTQNTDFVVTQNTVETTQNTNANWMHIDLGDGIVYDGPKRVYHGSGDTELLQIKLLVNNYKTDSAYFKVSFNVQGYYKGMDTYKGTLGIRYYLIGYDKDGFETDKKEFFNDRDGYKQSEIMWFSRDTVRITLEKGMGM